MHSTIKRIGVLLYLLLLYCTIGCNTVREIHKTASLFEKVKGYKQNEKAILLIPIDTLSTLEVTQLEGLLSSYKQAFDQHDIYLSLSPTPQSDSIYSTESWLAALEYNGYKKVLLQPLFIASKAQYSKLQELVSYFANDFGILKIALATPLLYEDESITPLAINLLYPYELENNPRQPLRFVLSQKEIDKDPVVYDYLKGALNTQNFYSQLVAQEQIDTLPGMRIIPLSLLRPDNFVEPAMANNPYVVQLWIQQAQRSLNNIYPPDKLHIPNK